MWCIVKNATQKLGKIGSITIEIPKVAYVTGGGICCRPTFKLFSCVLRVDNNAYVFSNVCCSIPYSYLSF